MTTISDYRMLIYSSAKIHTGPTQQIVKSTKQYDIAKKCFELVKTAKNFQKNSARDPTEYTLRTSVIILSFILSTKKSCVPLSAFFLSRSFQIFWIFDLKFSLSSKIMSKADEYFKFLKDNTSLQRWWFKVWAWNTPTVTTAQLLILPICTIL